MGCGELRAHAAPRSREPPVEQGRERVLVHLDGLDVEVTPERELERRRRGADRPRRVRSGAAAAQPVDDEAQVPVGEVVAEEEQVAPSQPGSERDGNRSFELARPRVVDVVVLGDDEALPGAAPGPGRRCPRRRSRTVRCSSERSA